MRGHQLHPKQVEHVQDRRACTHLLAGRLALLECATALHLWGVGRLIITHVVRIGYGQEPGAIEML